MMSSNAIAKDDHKNVEYVVETVTGRMDKNNSSSSHGSSNDENHLPSLHLYATSSVMTIIPHSTNDSEEQEVPFLGSSSSRSTLLLPMAQPNQHAFLPDFTEHPKPRKKKKVIVIESEDEEPQKATPPPPPPVEQQDNEKEEDEITFFHDFVAGGVAGSASVIVGHPFDTMKVRMQMSSSSGILSTFREFGGLHSLFRGMAAPLATAAAVNAVVFGSYGFSSRLYDTYIIPEQSSSQSRDQNNNNNDDNDDDLPNHDPWQKAMACGSFAGAVQCVIICPMEHVKCRLQMQQQFQGPMDCIQKIVRDHGVTRLFQGWWTTCWREIPAFGLYFASYDYLKDQANSFFLKRQRQQIQQNGKDSHNLDSLKISNTHTWLSSAFAGGCAGSLTWACVYPVDVIKTRVQTASLDTPFRNLRMYDVGKSIVQKHGVRYLFRGLGITLIRAFPVNGTIFPVYEFTLQQVTSMGY